MSKQVSPGALKIFTSAVAELRMKGVIKSLIYIPGSPVATHPKEINIRFGNEGEKII